VRGLTNQAGSPVEYYAYTPYGSPTILDAAGSPLGTSSVGNPWLFTGRRFDAETGMLYYRARYYDPQLGRFHGRDPLGYVDGESLYEYASSSPLKTIDPSGQSSLHGTFWAAVAKGDVNTMIAVLGSNAANVSIRAKDKLTPIFGIFEGVYRRYPAASQQCT